MEEKFIQFIKKPVVFRSIYFIACMVIAFGFGVFAEYSVANKGNIPAVELPQKPIPLAMRYKATATQNLSDYIPATPVDGETRTQDIVQLSSADNFVASKTGTKYYPAGCGSIDRIKPENRVYFVTEQEAKDKGYERTATCQ